METVLAAIPLWVVGFFCLRSLHALESELRRVAESIEAKGE